MKHPIHGTKIDLGERRGMLAFVRLGLEHAKMELSLAREHGFSGIIPDLVATVARKADQVARLERELACVS